MREHDKATVVTPTSEPLRPVTDEEELAMPRRGEDLPVERI
jgi:hypothetical protein